MKKMALYAIAGIVVFVLFIVIVWNLKRSFNYSWGYESQVTQTVCDMIKPEKYDEFLVSPEKCR